MELYEFVSGSALVHSAGRCDGDFCVIHKPSKHHMRFWPLALDNSSALCFRICPHGLHHPDPDSFAHKVKAQEMDLSYIHECDGCCAKPEEIPLSEIMKDLQEIMSKTE